MAIVTSTGFAHVRLTVTDIARSKDFYDRVFGWPTAIDESGRVDEPGVREAPHQFYGGVVYQTPSGALFGLRPVGGQPFDSERTGLDHVSFLVTSGTTSSPHMRRSTARTSNTATSRISPTPGSPSCRSPIQMASISN